MAQGARDTTIMPPFALCDEADHLRKLEVKSRLNRAKRGKTTEYSEEEHDKILEIVTALPPKKSRSREQNAQAKAKYEQVCEEFGYYVASSWSNFADTHYYEDFGIHRFVTIRGKPVPPTTNCIKSLPLIWKKSRCSLGRTAPL